MASTVSNYNIKQITNYDVEGYPTISYNISIPKRSETPNEKGEYEIIMVTKSIPYITAVDGVQIEKLGYCCEPSGLIYPIYLKVNNSNYKQFKLGKEGMYEFQSETYWNNFGEEEKEQKLSNVIVTGVRVPANINFTLDYIVPIN